MHTHEFMSALITNIVQISYVAQIIFLYRPNTICRDMFLLIISGDVNQGNFLISAFTNSVKLRVSYQKALHFHVLTVTHYHKRDKRLHIDLDRAWSGHYHCWHMYVYCMEIQIIDQDKITKLSYTWVPYTF